MTVAHGLLVPVPPTTSDEPTPAAPLAGGAVAGGPAAPALRPVEDLSYEQARDELVSVVARLETGGETLEGSLRLWERGEALAARCQQWLDGARERLQATRTTPSDAQDHTQTPDGQDAR